MSARPRRSRPPPATQPPPPSRRGVWLLASLAVATLLLGAAFPAWQRHRLATRVHAGLPARPALTGQPAALGERLAQAVAKTHSADTLLEGVAELGRLYHANLLPQEAAACWQVLRSEQPDEARWSYYLADANRTLNNHAGLAAMLEETLRLAPDYTPARLQLATLQFKSGEVVAADRNYRQVLAALPHDPHARLGLVRLAGQAGQTAEVRTQLERLLQDAPHFATAHNLYAELLAAAGDESGAARHRWLGAETLRYRDPADPWLEELQAWCHDYGRLCALGTLEQQTGNRAPARSLFERAIQASPGEPTAYELLADLHLKHHDAAAARELLEQALPRLTRRNSPLFFSLLSPACRSLDRPDDALKYARLGLEQAGEQPELADALALALAAAGRAEEAVATWQAALARYPDDATMHHHLATSLLPLGRLDDALAALDRALALQPRMRPALLLRGEIELEAGHLDRAEHYLRPAFAAHPADPHVRSLLARWHLKNGAAAEARNEPARAEQHYRDGLALAEDHAELQISLGVFYLVRSRPAEAIGPLTAYHRLQPENAEGCLFLGQACLAAGQRGRAREILLKGIQLAEHTGRTRTADHCRNLLQQL